MAFNLGQTQLRLGASRMAVPFDKIKASAEFFRSELRPLLALFTDSHQVSNIPNKVLVYKVSNGLHILTMIMMLDIKVAFCFLTSTERISRCRKQEKVRPTSLFFCFATKNISEVLSGSYQV